MYIKEIYRASSTEEEFIEGFIADIAAKSGGRILCTAKALDAATPSFTLTVDGIYRLSFRRDTAKAELAAGGYNVAASRGIISEPYLMFGNSEYYDRTAVRTWKYNIVCNSKTMLLELGSELTDMTQTAVLSMLSFAEGSVSGVSGTLNGASPSEGYFAMQDNTALTLHDRINIAYSPDNPNKVRVSKNKQLYEGNEFAVVSTGMRDCMYVPAGLLYAAGGRQYFSLDAGSYSTDPTTASTVMEV